MSDRYVLGVAYQAGPDPRIRYGADGSRDFFTPRELELAAWQYLRKGRQIGLQHADGTVGAGEVVESYLYRNDVPWTDADGQVIAKSGDWLLGAIVDEPTYAAVLAGKITGWSPQGAARRIQPREE